MCFQNLIQVYSVEASDSESMSAVVVYGKLEKLGQTIDPQVVFFDISDAKDIGKALIELHDEYYSIDAQ
jgi:hypothetical protein